MMLPMWCGLHTVMKLGTRKPILGHLVSSILGAKHQRMQTLEILSVPAAGYFLCEIT